MYVRDPPIKLMQNNIYWDTNFNFKALDLPQGSMKQKILVWHFGNRFVLEAILQILLCLLFCFDLKTQQQLRIRFVFLSHIKKKFHS